MSKMSIFRRFFVFRICKIQMQYTRLPPEKRTMSGVPSWPPPQGYFGLMFLKHYTKLSDEKLLERCNTDWDANVFWGVLLGDNERIPTSLALFWCSHCQ